MKYYLRIITILLVALPLFVLTAIHVYNIIEEQNKIISGEYERKCNDLGATYEINPISWTCWDIDEEGYKYYWVISEDEKPYKVRGRR